MQKSLIWELINLFWIEKIRFPREIQYSFKMSGRDKKHEKVKLEHLYGGKGKTH